MIIRLDTDTQLNGLTFVVCLNVTILIRAYCGACGTRNRHWINFVYTIGKWKHEPSPLWSFRCYVSVNIGCFHTIKEIPMGNTRRNTLFKTLTIQHLEASSVERLWLSHSVWRKSNLMFCILFQDKKQLTNFQQLRKLRQGTWMMRYIAASTRVVR